MPGPEQREEFDVGTLEELRTSVADAGVSEQDVYERQRIAEDWEYIQHRLGLIKDAPEGHDRSTARPPATA